MNYIFLLVAYVIVNVLDLSLFFSFFFLGGYLSYYLFRDNILIFLGCFIGLFSYFAFLYLLGKIFNGCLLGHLNFELNKMNGSVDADRPNNFLDSPFYKLLKNLKLR